MAWVYSKECLPYPVGYGRVRSPNRINLWLSKLLHDVITVLPVGPVLFESELLATLPGQSLMDCAQRTINLSKIYTMYMRSGNTQDRVHNMEFQNHSAGTSELLA